MLVEHEPDLDVNKIYTFPYFILQLERQSRRHLYQTRGEETLLFRYVLVPVNITVVYLSQL